MTNDIALLPVDYLCVLDFEATCSDRKEQQQQPKPQEIIEFPTLLLNVKTGEIDSTFHQYIRPDRHPQLSDFCTELTGIQQETVNGGISITDALWQHAEWLAQNEIVPLTDCLLGGSKKHQKTFLYATCGDWDLSKCLPRQLKYQHIKVPACFQSWINVKHAFYSLHQIKAKGMVSMLSHYKLELQGRHHSGIDDCKNIARVCARMLQDGWKPRATTSVGATTL